VMSARTPRGKKLLVMPGDATESWLYILSGTDQLHFRMPPDTSHATPLPKEEVSMIGKWILQGAKDN
jgi:hypothetical protein